MFRGATLVGSSGGGTRRRRSTSLNPTAATYTVFVDGCATGNPSRSRSSPGSSARAAAGNMTVTAPAAATLGGTGTINLTFSGLTAGTKYLGSVAYCGATGMPNPTIVRVDP